MRIHISSDAADVSEAVARVIGKLVSERNAQGALVCRFPLREFQMQTVHEVSTSQPSFSESSGRPCVLGLATGSTPKQVYRHLVRIHREEGVSFQHVVTFNLDEYLGQVKMHVRSLLGASVPGEQSVTLLSLLYRPQALCRATGASCRRARGASWAHALPSVDVQKSLSRCSKIRCTGAPL